MSDEAMVRKILCRYKDGPPLKHALREGEDVLLVREINRLNCELAEAREALGKAEAYIPTETVECRGDKCRELWCVSCFGEEEAEQEIERAKFLAEEIRALKEKP